MTTQITCVVTFHGEGSIAQKTLRALESSAAYARERGISVDVSAVLDRAEASTRQIVQGFAASSLALTCHETDLGDTGLARNAAIARAQGAYIAILDGDDLFAENWLYKAYRAADAEPKRVVHPEVTVCFDSRNVMVPQTSQTADGFNFSNYLFESYWSALGFAERSAFTEHPYVRTDSRSGFGYEDWHWNCEVMAHGYTHIIAPKTVQFVRLKAKNSRNESARSEHLLMPHSKLFDRVDLLKSLCGQ